MQRLLRKFETAKSLVPRPVRRNADEARARYGAIYYGSTSPAMDEAIHMIAARGQPLDMLRVRGFPFHQDVDDFIADHDFVFVVEQNRDGQLRTLITTECNIDPVRLVPILHYDGTPITARFIANAIGDHLDALKVTPLRKVDVLSAYRGALPNDAARDQSTRHCAPVSSRGHSALASPLVWIGITYFSASPRGAAPA